MRTHRILHTLAIVVSAVLPTGAAWAVTDTTVPDTPVTDTTATVTAVKQPQPIPGDVPAANALSGDLVGIGGLSQVPGTVIARSPWTTRTGPAQSQEVDREFLYAKIGSITFDLIRAENGSGPATGATLLWGSPDSYNQLKLLKDGQVVASIVPGGAVPVDPTHTYAVTIAGVTFDTLIFLSTQASFEFANLSVDQYEDALDCDETLEAGQSSIRRLFDVGGDSCEGTVTLPVDFTFDGDSIRLLADYSVLEAGIEPAFELVVRWNAEWVVPPTPSAIPYFSGSGNPPMGTPTLALSAPLSVQWFGGSPTPPEDESFFLDICPGSPVLDEQGNLVGFDLPEGSDMEDGPNDMSALEGFQFGCLAERIVVAVEDESVCPEPRPDDSAVCVAPEERVYLRRDWTATRTLR